jgi:hemolysin III
MIALQPTSIAAYGKKEELANSISHGIGVVFGLIGTIFLLNKTMSLGFDSLSIASMAVYGLSIITLFLASTLYHSVSKPKLKHKLKIFDHCAIFILIAGSYTPFLLVELRTPLAIGLMCVIWGVAFIGIGFKIAFIHRFKKAGLITYIAMGWLSVIVIYQLALTMEVGGLILLAAGGLVYSLGVIFYVKKRIPFNHAIWHLFVLGGCICHFLAIYLYVDQV